MRILINLAAHDGIISHYAGVGTIVRRYINVLEKILSDEEYELNLFTLEFNNNSMGYNKLIHKQNIKRKNTKLYILSNGTKGKTNYGNIENWRSAS